MKIIAILLLSVMLTLVAVAQRSWDNWPAVVTSSTNVDGSVLRLEFADSKVIAGDRLFGRMVVSNASGEFRQIAYSAQKWSRDAFIGDFVVADDQGNPIRKTIWGSLALDASGRLAILSPSNSAAFNADLVGRYSLTNPGTYLVKAVAQVATPEDEVEDVVVETPPVAITILPRPEGAPPPEPLYTAAELARVPKNEEPPQLKVTPPRSRTKPPSSNLQPRSGIGPPGLINPNVREPGPVTGTGANVAIDPSPSPLARSRTRTIAYACIVVLGLAVLGRTLWRSH